MPIPVGLHSLFVIMLIAAVTPLVVARLPGLKIPEVVLLIIFGIIVGPQALDIANFDSSISLVANFGLGMLFFLAGFELDRAIMVGQYGRAAAGAWLVSMALSLGVVGWLDADGFVRACLPIAIALTTTAMGVLLPMLRDAGEHRGPFGRAMLANGAVGELFPIIAISVFLSGRGTWAALALLLVFGALAYAVSRIATGLRGRSISELIQRGSETSSQTTVRFAVLLLVALLLVSGRLGLDAILGAFAAGIVLRVALPDGDRALEHKLNGLAFGFFIPAFFVVSGMQLDIDSILKDPARMLVFFVLMVAMRGLPVLVIFRRWFPGTEALRMALYSATGLPLIVAITAIGLQTGVMRPDNAAALVGAGLLTVIILPMTARLIPHRAADVVPDATADIVPATE
jgi:Kef-type K+ transport system membrane component KefB